MSSATNPWRIATATMRIELDPVTVRSTTVIEAHRTTSGIDDLFLHGRNLVLEKLSIDGREVVDRSSVLVDGGLRIPVPGESCVVEYTVMAPTGSPGQSGFVAQPRLLSTQCEPEGFRHITYFIDEPSNRTVFDVTLVGDKTAYPRMLSNGDQVGAGELDGHRHWARFVDPVSKPSYLFAMVAGGLEEVSTSYRTKSGRTITLKVVALPEFVNGAQFALDTLGAAMKLDEDTLHAEHDLDTLVLVAIPEYPDATEYHGLMFFEQAILVVDQRGFVDDDLMTIAANIAHEYGHQVRGNRVTVSTWRDLTVKEGLTVMAQNEFRAHQFGKAGRVLDVLDLRRLQFPEEVTIGAPVVQAEGGDPKRLYTRTTYLKGAEIFRMMRTVVGEDAWWGAMRAFYADHDLGAVTVEDFVSALCARHPEHADTVSGIARWFHQAGRPHVGVSVSGSSAGVDVTIERSDSLGDEPPLPMPVSLGFLSSNGEAVQVLPSNGGHAASEQIVMLDSRSRTFSFAGEGVAVVTPLRAYSAPVDVATDHTLDQFGAIAAHDPDAYSRWWATEQLKIAAIDAHRRGESAAASIAVDRVVSALRHAIATEDDPAFLAQVLALPDEYALGDRDQIIDVDGVAGALDFLRDALGVALSNACASLVRNIVSTDRGGTSPADIARRMPLEPLLALLLASHHVDIDDLVASCLESENNTIAMRAFAQMAHRDNVDIETISSMMYARWHGAPRLLDRWIRARSGSRRSDTVEWVAQFVQSPMYDRNDRARVTAVWFPFCTRNRAVFHSPSGRGYEVFVDELAHLMPSNSGLAVRFVGDLLQFQRFDPARTALMRAQLERMTAMKGMPDFAVAILHSLLGTA